MAETYKTNISKVRQAGFVCMMGGMMFFLYFIGLNSLLEILSPPLEPQAIPTVKMVISRATSVCLAGVLLGLLALDRRANPPDKPGRMAQSAHLHKST